MYIIMRSIIFLILFIGIILMVIGYTRKERNKEKQFTKIEYRYIPRNLYMEQLQGSNSETSESKKIKSIFKRKNIGF